MALLSSFGKEGIRLGLLNEKVDIEDLDPSSKYFALSEFNPLFSGGKNVVGFNGSPLLKDGTEIQVECLDSKGNSLYVEHARAINSQFTDASKFLIGIHVYNEISNGVGKLVLVGTTTKNEIVRWIANITIDKTLDNNSGVRFYYRPTLEVRPILYPVVDTEKVHTDYPPPVPISIARGVASSTSGIGSVTMNSLGSGYNNTTTVYFEYGGAHTTRATGHPIVSGGQIVEIVIDNPGEGYDENNVQVQIRRGNSNGSGATATANLRSVVTGVSLTDGGSGYSFIPDIVFGGPGSGASAEAVVTDGVVTSIIFDPNTDGGSGYTSTPKVTFEIPPPPEADDLNVSVNFSASFYTYAGNPVKNTNKRALNAKQTDIDYRLTITSSEWNPLTSQDFDSPIKAFNTQMEGEELILHINKVQLPYSTQDSETDITASYIIKNVLDSKTVQLNEPYFSQQGKNLLVSNITEGRCFLNYRLILYNTNPDANLQIYLTPEYSVEAKESYAEVTYRNIECFSGFVARHKLYRKSSYYPGEFQLISDELLEPPELLLDPVTVNKFYEKMGEFYNQPHAEKYWFSNSDALTITASVSPINSMKISADSYELADGTNHVIAKNDSLSGVNDNIYYPYDETEYNRLSGSSYNSNFISLKKGSMYSLSTLIKIDKDDSDTSARVEFYFTSSIETIQTEKTYDSQFGMKIGGIQSLNSESSEYFNGTQAFYFTPENDYFGTLVVVPYHCNVTLSELSLKLYGDHGFSPEALVINIPFPINVQNEAFDIKAELLDINSNVVYSNLKTVQTFDPNGESLLNADLNTVNSVINIDNTTNNVTNVTISGTPYFPDLEECDDTIRLVGWHRPTNPSDGNDGKLCYTNVSRLFIDNGDYISLSAFTGGVEESAKAIAVRYDLDISQGRKIFIDAAGTKEELP